MRTIESERIPIKLWLEDIEDSAVEQAKNIANSPVSFHHIAIMPDSHFGVGVAIGTVFTSDVEIKSLKYCGNEIPPKELIKDMIRKSFEAHGAGEHEIDIKD